ncbi:MULTISPECIES: hypothetical protein [Paenibacillus]|uniref:hypothetical protein n=1 Tax=Paenibacillus TaxID=44249 RepID=UPI0006D5B33A|nr:MULTISPECIES: hypothetical protein [Paenibacillus]
MADFSNPGPSSNNPDPGGHKANHDVNAQKYHTEGVPGFWRQVTDLLIAVAVIAFIIFLVLWIF